MGAALAVRHRDEDTAVVWGAGPRPRVTNPGEGGSYEAHAGTEAPAYPPPTWPTHGKQFSSDEDGDGPWSGPARDKEEPAAVSWQLGTRVSPMGAASGTAAGTPDAATTTAPPPPSATRRPGATHAVPEAASGLGTAAETGQGGGGGGAAGWSRDRVPLGVGGGSGGLNTEAPGGATLPTVSEVARRRWLIRERGLAPASTFSDVSGGKEPRCSNNGKGLANARSPRNTGERL